METVKKIDAFLGTMDYQLNVTVFAIMLAFTMGMVLPSFFILVR